jgi:hypothetical protein
MVPHNSYTQTEGERELAGFMAREMQGLGLAASLTPVPRLLDEMRAVARILDFPRLPPGRRVGGGVGL